MNRLKEVSSKDRVPLTLLTDWGPGRNLCAWTWHFPMSRSSEVPFSNVVVPPQVKAFVTQDIPL